MKRAWSSEPSTLEKE